MFLFAQETSAQHESFSLLARFVKRLRAHVPRARWLALAAVGTGSVACGPEPVTIDLVFPALSYLALADRAEVLAVRRSGPTRCAQLATNARANSLPSDSVARTDTVPICDLRDGGATLDLEPGNYDLLAVGRGADRVVLVVGCARAHIGDEGGEQVSVLMANLSSEGQRRIEVEPACAGVAAWCAGDCEP
jgi:hypothetical protein